MRVVAIIQCRLGSSRLPAKALLDFHGKTMLARVIERCRLAGGLADVVVATSDRPADDLIVAAAQAEGAASWRGPLEDARQRLLGCARAHGAEAFVRVTGDNPFVEPSFIDDMIAAKAQDGGAYLVHDLAAVVHGTASELVETAALEELLRRGELPPEGREHVTSGLAALPGSQVLRPDPALSDPQLSLTVDTIGQYESAWRAMARFGHGRDTLPRIVSAFRGAGPEAGIFQTRG